MGYGVTVGLYPALPPGWPLPMIAALGNVICITLSFAVYKLFIFKGRGNWLTEYARSYVVYGGAALFGIAGLWLPGDVVGLPVWLAQGMVMGVSVVGSFFGHDLFTFKKKSEPSLEVLAEDDEDLEFIGVIR